MGESRGSRGGAVLTCGPYRGLNPTREARPPVPRDSLRALARLAAVGGHVDVDHARLGIPGRAAALHRDLERAHVAAIAVDRQHRLVHERPDQVDVVHVRGCSARRCALWGAEPPDRGPFPTAADAFGPPRPSGPLAIPHPAALPTPGRGSELDLPDGVLDLPDDR